MKFDTAGILRQIDGLFDDAKQYADEGDKDQLAVACVARAEQWRMVHAICERLDTLIEQGRSKRECAGCAKCQIDPWVVVCPAEGCDGSGYITDGG